MIDLGDIKNVYDILCHSKVNSGSKIAIVDDNSTISYDCLLSKVNDTISKLSDEGIKPGERVALYGDATIRWVVAFLSLMSMGAIVIPINPFFDTSLIKKYMKYAGTEKIINTCTELFDTRTGRTPRAFVADARAPLGDDNSTSLMIFTSGTESEPKLTCLTQKNIISSLDKLYLHFKDILDIGGDKCLIAIPFNHIYGIIILIQTLLHSYTAYITKTISPQTISKLIIEHDIRSLYSVALIFDALCANPAFEKSRDLLTANFISGAHLTKEHFDLYKMSYKNATFFNIYGTTEATGAISITKKDDYDTYDKFSKGKILEGYDVAIYKDGAYNKTYGISGEVVFKSDTMLKEYYNLPKEKSNIDNEGWFHTGDIGILLAEDRLEIIGRIKDIIIKGGENISALEIENELAKSECIDKVAVVSMPDEKYGEEIYAYVTLKESMAYDEEKLRERLKVTLGSFKVPKKIIVLDAMPLNTLGKVIKSDLKKEKIL